MRIYTDYRSPYAYLAMAGAYQLEQDFHLQLDWYPYAVDLEAVYGAVDARSEREWRKLRYLYGDVRRQANARPAGQGHTQGVRPHAGQPGHAVCQTLWRAARLPGPAAGPVLEPPHGNRQRGPGGALPAGRRAGRGRFPCYAAVLGRRNWPKCASRQNAKACLACRRFIFGGELFWGPDRLDHLRARLRQAGLQRQAIAAPRLAAREGASA